ncbi:hypothetical protein LTR28_008930, partial [Elasticomyces elasticus]
MAIHLPGYNEERDVTKEQHAPPQTTSWCLAPDDTVVDQLFNSSVTKPSIGVSLRPNDPAAKKIMSRDNKCQNFLVKVTMPKRTGPLPDFQQAISPGSLMTDIQRHLLPMNLNSIKQFNPDLQPGFLPEADIAPPARFSNFNSGANYLYLQNPSVMTRVDHNGELVTQNRNLIPKRVVSSVAADVEQVPQGPKQQLKPTRGYERYIQKTVDELEKVLKERPVVTRRVALNAISEDNESTFKEATQYVGYSFSSGPWKDALIKYGVDPRTDPKYRFYQTLSFQLVPRNENSRKGPDAVGPKEWLRSERWRKDTSKSHIFDGQSIVPNGKTWQICDITDPMLRNLLHIEDVATECD